MTARALQLFAPGIPQVYYARWLGLTNDVELADSTGDPREINRHYLTREQVDKAVDTRLVKRITRLMEFRSTYPAFQGTFHLQYSNEKSVSIAWKHGEHRCELFADLLFKKSTITYEDPNAGRTLTIKC